MRNSWTWPFSGFSVVNFPPNFHPSARWGLGILPWLSSGGNLAWSPRWLFLGFERPVRKTHDQPIKSTTWHPLKRPHHSVTGRCREFCGGISLWIWTCWPSDARGLASLWYRRVAQRWAEKAPLFRLPRMVMLFGMGRLKCQSQGPVPEIRYIIIFPIHIAIYMGVIPQFWTNIWYPTWLILYYFIPLYQIISHNNFPLDSNVGW